MPANATKGGISFDVLSLNETKDYILSNTMLQLECAKDGIDISPLCMSGKPGIGKSYIYREFCSEKGWGLSVQYMSLRTIEQLSGLPIPKITINMSEKENKERDNKIDEMFLKWSVPLIFDFRNMIVKPNPSKTGGKPVIILLLDDYHLIEKVLQKYMFQLLTYRGINQHYLPKEVAIHLAGNRAEDRAGFQQINSAVVNRILFLDVDSEAKDWVDNYAVDNNVRNDIVMFISHNPSYLSAMPLENTAWASPRSWTYASRNMDAMLKYTGKLTPTMMTNVLKGSVGLEYATEFIKYKELIAKWTPEKIFSGERQIDWDNEIKRKPINGYSLMAATVEEFLKILREDEFRQELPRAGVWPRAMWA